MKKTLLSIVIVVILISCTKSGGLQINPDFTPIENQINRAQINITTTGKDYYGKTVTNKEMALSKLIVAPSGTGNVTLQYTVTSTNQAKDVRWYIDNTLIGSGNDVPVNFETIGDKNLKVVYKDATTNAEYSKELTLRVHTYIVADITLTNLDICGEYSIVGSLNTVKKSIDCVKRSLELKDMVYQISSFNNTLLIGFFKGENLTIKLITIQANSLNNFAKGTYIVGDNTVTIK